MILTKTDFQYLSDTYIRFCWSTAQVTYHFAQVGFFQISLSRGSLCTDNSRRISCGVLLHGRWSNSLPLRLPSLHTTVQSNFIGFHNPIDEDPNRALSETILLSPPNSLWLSQGGNNSSNPSPTIFCSHVLYTSPYFWDIGIRQQRKSKVLATAFGVRTKYFCERRHIRIRKTMSTTMLIQIIMMIIQNSVYNWYTFITNLLIRTPYVFPDWLVHHFFPYKVQPSPIYSV